MPIIEKLLLVVGLARGLYGKWLITRIIPMVITVASLTIIGSVMVSALLLAAMQFSYASMIASGIPSMNAGFIILGVALIFLLLVVSTVGSYIRRIRSMIMPQWGGHNTAEKKPHTDAGSVIDAFIAGLTNR